MLELENVTKVVRGQTHIKPTSLMFESGHFNVLLGQTGAGKTSLIKLMAGLDKIASGNIRLRGHDVTAWTPQQREISLVHQFFINYPHLSVFENIASPLRVAGMAASEVEERVLDAADLLKITPMLQRRPHELSGGQQQRTALARAIAKPAKAVFLDEPLANLDYKLREELRALLPELFAGRGAVVVYATSEPEEALLLGGKTALMSDGTVSQFGSTVELYRSPETLLSAQIFSDPPINYAKVEKQGDVVLLDQMRWTWSSTLPSIADGEYYLAIRPHHVLPYQDSESTVAITGQVGVTELSGSESSAHFSFGAHRWVSLAHGVHVYARGENHQFYFDPQHCYFFTSQGQRVA